MEYRLKRNKDFQFLFKKGKNCRSSCLIMIYHPARSLKVGYSVSKKHGKSVVRNRVKRLMRAAFYNVKPQIKQNVYIIFLPKVRENYSYAEFLKDMKYMLSKEGII